MATPAHQCGLCTSLGHSGDRRAIDALDPKWLLKQGSETITTAYLFEHIIGRNYETLVNSLTQRRVPRLSS